MHPSIKFNYFL